MLHTIQAAAAGGEHSILLPELHDLFWSAVILTILFVAFLKFLYPKYTELMDERSHKIQSGLDFAEQAKGQVARADETAAQKLLEAKEAAAQIRAEAQIVAKDIVEKAKADASAEADRIVAQASRQIEAQRQAAEISLRSELGLLAADLAEKVVGEQLQNQELSARVVDRFLDELESSGAVKDRVK